MAVALAVMALGAAPSRSQELPFPPDHHPWGHFPVHSWKQVRTTSESLDEKGHVASLTITDTRTQLLAADDSSYTLLTETTVNVASQRIAAAPQTKKYGYYGESAGQTLGVKRAADASLTIDGRAIPCEVRQISLAGDGGKLVSTLYYCSQCPPFVLRRETSAEGAAEGKPQGDERNSSLVEVVALDLPQRVRGELKQASYIKTTHKLPQSLRVTLEVHCDDVPGGVAAHWSSETDAAGRVLRRSTLELIDYGVAAPPGQAQPGQAQPAALPAVIRRPLRAGKAARRMDPR